MPLPCLSRWTLTAGIRRGATAAILLSVSCLVGVQPTSLTAQQATSPNEAEGSSAPQLLEPETVQWRMGLELRGGPGRTLGVRATCPLPVEWPEQQIEIVKETKTENVGRVKRENLDGAVQQMMIVVPELGPGEVARVVVELKIKKAWMLPPEETESLEFATRFSRELRGYLRPSPFIESRDRRIREIAEQLAEQTAGQPAWQQVEAIYDWVREHVEYRFDEKIKSCLEALDDGHGDCEELSSLFIAICRARNIPARAVWIPGHTYPEFYLEDEAGQGHWYPCQAAGSREFGGMSESRPILQKGDRFKIHGHRQPMRYVQPTLTAKDATSSPAVQWILERTSPAAATGQGTARDR